MSWKSRRIDSTSKSVVSQKLTLFLCLACFCGGMLFTDRFVLLILLYLYINVKTKKISSYVQLDEVGIGFHQSP